jgi:two-component system chemotaxis sensor kinase CheA
MTPMEKGFDADLLLAEYRGESRQQLDDLDRRLVQLEERGELRVEERQELLRVLHTLKGNSAMMGYSVIADQVHQIENLLKASEHSAGIPNLDPIFEISAALRSAMDRLGGPEQEVALARVAAIDLSAATGPIGRSSAPPPAAERSPPAPDSSADPEVITETAALPAERVVPGSAEVLRVPFVKLDLLLSRVSELVSLHSRFEAFSDRNREALFSTGLYRELDEQIEDLAAQASALQDATMDLRTVPLRTVFGRFPAVVRDLARRQGKRARVELEGESIELDKSAVDALGEPLLHLVRNAVDHGLETPETRERSGKDAVGTISLRAARVGDHIVLTVADDGAGLDRAEILRRARANGLIDRGEKLSAEEIGNLIFSPDFSTRREATTVSGRGVGLDIARRTLLRLRGSLEVRDNAGGGTAFVLRLPLTLAIVPALIFELEGEVLALPATDVQETLTGARFERVGGTEVIRDEQTIVPIARPHQLFGWGNGAGDGGNPSRSRYAIVVRRGGRSAAIPADRLLDQRSVVVKALPHYLGQLRGVSGVTVAPDGRVILLIDCDVLLDLNLHAQRRVAR